jgi:hypothetical protein
MDSHLLYLATALGLAAAVGLNTTLPVLLIGLAHTLGLARLAPPYDTLGEPVVLVVLVLLVVLELAGDKLSGLDTLLQTIQLPVTLVAGAIMAGTQAPWINASYSELVLLLGLATAGGIHLIRATLRPLVHLLPLRIVGGAISVGEDVGAVLLVAIALAVPPLAPLALLILFVVWMVLFYYVCRVLLLLARHGLRLGGQVARSLVLWLSGRQAGPYGAPAPSSPPQPGDAGVPMPLPTTADIWNDGPGTRPGASAGAPGPATTSRPDIWDV